MKTIEESLKVLKLKPLKKLRSYITLGLQDPRDIFTLLEDDYPLLEMKTIYNVIKKEKVRKGKFFEKFTVADLKELCEKHSKTGKSETPYVLTYETSPHIRILFTQRKLFEYIQISPNIHIDGTYKLNIYGFPVIVIGISDLNRRFFCSAICIAEFEDSATYTWNISNILSHQSNSEDSSIPKKKLYCR